MVKFELGIDISMGINGFYIFNVVKSYRTLMKEDFLTPLRPSKEKILHYLLSNLIGSFVSTLYLMLSPPVMLIEKLVGG